jgi:outer membrane receptor protein involved in Fe transport
VVVGGNAHLQPETSRDWSVGGVVTPRLAPVLSLEIDYYNVVINNTILSGGYADAATSPGPDLLLDGCYGPAQNALFCSMIQRSPTSGAITTISSLNTNFGTETVSGIDYELIYDTAAADLLLPFAGSLRLDLQVGQLLSHTSQNPDGTTNVAQGTFQYASEAIQPVWKGQFSLDYDRGPWVARWGTRFLGALKNIDGSPQVYGNETPNS